jgi:PAS domain S-box-containing protein
MTLRAKILLPLVFFGAILTAYLYGYWMPQSLESLRNEHQVSTERHLDSVIEGLIPLLLGHQLDTIFENLDALRNKNREWLDIELDDAQGKSLYPLSGVALPTAKATSGEIKLLKRDIDYLGTNLGVLAVRVDFASWLAQAEAQQRELVVVVLIVIVAFFASAAYVLERVVVRPVNALSKAASELARNRFDVQLEKSGDDEVGNLVDRFAEMREALSGYQAELLQRSEILKRSREGLAEVQRMAQLGSWELDATTNRMVWSEEVYQIFGLDPQLHEASSESLLAAVHPGDSERVTAAYVRRGQDGAPYDFVYQIVRASDKEIRYVREICEPVRGEEGRLMRFRGTLHDITELKRAEEEIRQLNQELERRVAERTAQLEAANQELESFSYSVSHDLRTPLRTIDGFSHILLEDYADKVGDEGRRLLNVVSDNTSRMEQLIDDILKFSRTGRAEITHSEIDMEKMAHAVAAELMASDPGGKLQMEIEPIPATRGDSAMLRQVFVNLLSNAIKFSRHNAIPKIHVGASVKDNETIYYVKDNGAGFDMQYADKLFGVFQRLHGANEFEGTGIGLAIVKRIITRHGGRVWAEGKVNEGATFYFALQQPPGKELAGEKQ